MSALGDPIDAWDEMDDLLPDEFDDLFPDLSEPHDCGEHDAIRALAIDRRTMELMRRWHPRIAHEIAHLESELVRMIDLGATEEQIRWMSAGIQVWAQEMAWERDLRPLGWWGRLRHRAGPGYGMFESIPRLLAE
jgi:hypothetical protein